jgi:hypothetical protein
MPFDLKNTMISPAQLSRVARAPGYSPSSATLLGLAIGLLSSLGCSASAEIPEVVVTQSDIEFEGVPRIPGFTDFSMTVTTSFEHPEGFDLPEFLNPRLRPLTGSITGVADMDDLSFLEELTLTLASRAEGAPPPSVLASYVRTSAGLVGRVVQMETDGDADVVEYWSTKDAYYDVTLSGLLPEEPWAIDVSIAFEGKFSVSSSD